MAGHPAGPNHKVTEVGPRRLKFAVDMLKTAIILEGDDDAFLLEYDNNLGQKNTMRLDAVNYHGAVHEAKSYLGVNDENLDGDGTEWKFH